MTRTITRHEGHLNWNHNGERRQAQPFAGSEYVPESSSEAGQALRCYRTVESEPSFIAFVEESDDDKISRFKLYHYQNR